jgi:hypothetical protein
MVKVTLRIEPDLCGSFSFGTARVIKLVLAHFELTLDAAADYVNRCVFSGEEVDLRAPSTAAAEQFIAAVAGLPPVPRVVAHFAVAPSPHK